MHLWVQDYRNQIYTKAGADAIIALARGKFDRLLIATRSDYDAAVIFNATDCALRQERIDGMLPGEYLAQEAHKVGMAVDLWFYVGFFGTYNGMYAPPDASWNLANYPCGSSAPGWIDFSIPAARAKVVSHILDLATNSAADGVCLDYLRMHMDNVACSQVTADHITDVLLQVRAGIGDRYLTAACGRTRESSAYVRRDVDRWAGICDNVLMMTYDHPPGDGQSRCYDYLLSLPPGVMPGLGTMPRTFDGVDWAGQDIFEVDLVWYEARGIDDFHVFDSQTLTREMTALLPDIEEDGDMGVVENMIDRGRILREQASALRIQADSLESEAAGIDVDVVTLRAIDDAMDAQASAAAVLADAIEVD